MYMELIQEALVAAGYDPGPVDGIEGPLTQAAIAAFQADHGLAADGLVGPLTHAALFRGDVPVAGADSGTGVSVADSDGQLTAHFNREEFRCCCEGRYCDGFPAEMQADLLLRLEAVRVALGAAVIVVQRRDA